MLRLEFTSCILIPMLPLQPMPLRRRRDAFDHPDWLFELKYDGFRALAVIKPGRAQLISRNGHPFASYADLAASIAADLEGGWCEETKCGWETSPGVASITPWTLCASRKKLKVTPGYVSLVANGHRKNDRISGRIWLANCASSRERLSTP